MKKHVEEKHFRKCEECPYFGSDLKRHKLRHSKEHGKCSQCRYFGKHLKDHIKKMHTDILEYPCHLCQFVSESPDSLRNHFLNSHLRKETASSI